MLVAKVIILTIPSSTQELELENDDTIDVMEVRSPGWCLLSAAETKKTSA
jgi:hypothetical protein